MLLGIDVSTYFEEKEAGAKYLYHGQEIDPLEVFTEHGVSLMRIRVWNNPYSPEGEPYLAGTCDKDNFIKLAEVAKSYGYHIILDFHYSDFWADPGKQFCPKAWEGLSYEEVVKNIYEFTKNVLEEAKTHEIPIDFVQVGNEITNGMTYPYGKLDDTTNPRGNYEALAGLLKSGSKAVREVYPEAKIILHLERSFDHEVYKEFFSHIIPLGVDFDIIGCSYYPYWHGTFEQLFYNLTTCRELFHKDIMIMELGYAFTLEDYIQSGSQAQLVINETSDMLDKLPEPLNPEGQARFVRSFLKEAEKHDVVGVVYWEPLWIPGENICWASKAGQKYIHEEGKSTRNEWANQCLFDYNGVALPAFDEFKLEK